MEKRRAAGQLFGGVIFKDGPDDRAFRKYGSLREYAPREHGSGRSDSQPFERLTAGQTLPKKL